MIADDDCYDEEAVNYASIFSTVKQREELFIFLEEKIKELTRYFKEKGIDYNLNYIGVGSTSVVFSIGDKVVKFGIPRTCPILPYCEFLLQPIRNEDIKFDGKDVHVEVNQKVDNLDDTSLDDVVDYLDTQSPKIGLYFSDTTEFNVGLLSSRQENCIHYSNNPSLINSEKLTSIRYNCDLHLKKGVYPDIFDGFPVIKDLDGIDICNIEKYVEYLRIIGFDKETIKKVIIDYHNGIFGRKVFKSR